MTGPSPSQDASPLRVLVADDDDGMRELVVAILERNGHRVTAVTDGEAAVAAARKERFQLAILDFMMPGKNGLETMDALKAGDPDIEVVIITAQESEKVGSDAVARGAYGYLNKPFEPAELEAIIPGIKEKLSLKTLVGLYEITRRIFANVQLKDLLADLTALARQLLIAKDVSVMLLGEDGFLRIAASSGLEERVWHDVRIPLGEGVAGRVAQWKTGVTIHGSLQSDPRFADLPSRGGNRSTLIHPIILKEQLVGILCANREEGAPAFSHGDVRHAVIFCAQIGQAIENAKLYEKLEAARKDAAEANLLKDELLYMTSHDLKAPLTAVSGYAEFLLQHSGNAAAVEGSAERIRTTVSHMLALVQQILRKGQVESANFWIEKRPTSAAAALDECLEGLSVVAAMQGRRLVKENRVPPESQANIDPNAFGEIVSNLVANAVKFSGKNGEVKVVLDKAGADLVLEVSDNGPGISPEEQKRIFGKFQRGSTATAEGSGYGLAIVKRLAELHGGRVELDSSPGRGSTFRVVLPVD